MFNKLPHIHRTMAINKVYLTKYINQANNVILQNGWITILSYCLHCQKERGGLRLTLGFVFLKNLCLMRQNPLISPPSIPEFQDPVFCFVVYILGMQITAMKQV